ncbi:MAG: leucine-rich repeat protein [Bacteroidales bacterium]|nr:leucine-rich repeat protein [Bacteroidales bacterium]
MRVIYHIILHVTFAVMLVSCLSEPYLDPVQETGIPINFDASINHTQTKVNAQGFEDGDALGMYAVNYVENNTTPGILQPADNQADHVKYIFDESKWTWKPVYPVYYQDINTNVDIYAFYPYDEPASVSAYNFEVQKDQNTPKRNGKLGGYEASDFLWGKTENVTPTESSIKVRLDHMMSGVHVILKEGTGFEAAGDFPLIEKTVLVTNTTRKASINLSNGLVTPVGSAQTSGIVMAKQSDGTFRAVVVPQTVAAGSPLFNITIGGVAYDFLKDNAYEYIAGKLSQFTITVNRKMPSGEYEFILDDTQIVDWKEDINNHEGEARQYYCVQCDEPGTLGRLIKEDRKNPDKIRNLKVSGTIQASDFYFMRDSMALLQSVNLKEAEVFDAYAYYCSDNDNLLNGYVNHYFSESKTLSEIQEIYPNVFDIYEVRENVSEIPDMAFCNKSELVNFVFPEAIERIGIASFYGCNLLAGDLIIPDGVKVIDNRAFKNCNSISSLLLADGVEGIGEEAFMDCNLLSGQLLLPDSITYIKKFAFASCRGLSGPLVLPENLSILQRGAFSSCSGFSGDLIIPETLTILESQIFEECIGFNGRLILHDNIVQWDDETSNGCMFEGCSFQGELKLPKSLSYIPRRCFIGNGFSSIAGFPEGLIGIGERAFERCSRLQGNINLPESLVLLGERAFAGCALLEGIVLPSNLSVIGAEAFAGCSYLNNLRSMSSVPPAISSGAFNGVAKDNFTVEVPHNALALYRSDPQWSEFKRISPYYDFSLDRSLIRTLNSEESRTHVLRVPAGQPWSVESKPDWITIEPASGIGKTEITVTFQELRSEDAYSIQYDDRDDYGNVYAGYSSGREGEIVFLLNDKDHRINVDVQQFDYQYGDGSVIELNNATKGNGVDIVFIADGYDASEIASDKYMRDVRQAYDHFFDIEPYKSYKDYFDVYAVIGVSKDSGIGTVNTIRDVRFDSQYSPGGLSIDSDICYEYARKVYDGIDLTQTLIVLVQNTTDYPGQTFMSVDGSAIACCPKSKNAYPYDFRGIVQHEAGGHGFGKLADENIYFNDWIQNTSAYDAFMLGKSLGWYKNLDVTGGVNEVGWSHLIFNPKYSNTVDIFEGGYYYTRGIYRSEPTSCMNNNIPYYSAISRQAIVERIMEYAGEIFDLDEFLENDVHSAIIPTKSSEDMTLSYQQNTRHCSPVIIRN